MAKVREAGRGAGEWRNSSTDTAAFTALLNELRGPLTGVAAVFPLIVFLFSFFFPCAQLDSNALQQTLSKSGSQGMIELGCVTFAAACYVAPCHCIGHMPRPHPPAGVKGFNEEDLRKLNFKELADRFEHLSQVLPDALRCVQEVKQLQGTVQVCCSLFYERPLTSSQERLTVLEGRQQSEESCRERQFEAL
eukprot:474203-Hanusia_phi.AAC.4